MRALWPVVRLAWRAHPLAFAFGLLLLALTLAAGIALLGLAGWFITAGAIAGAAGAGVVFDVFRPGAAIRMLAITRTGARYGERLITHSATLRFLAGLRVRLFHGFATQPYARLAAMRGAIALNRLTGDVDALDAIYLRGFAPLVASMVALPGSLAILIWLVDVWMGLWVVGVIGGASAIVLAIGVRTVSRPVRRHAYALDAVRLRLIDLVRGAADFAVSGRLAGQIEAVERAGRRSVSSMAALDRIERAATVAVPVVVMTAAAGALVIGAWRDVPAPRIALAVFVAIALNEAVQPLRRVVLDFVRASMAARRLGPLLEAGPAVDSDGVAHPQHADGDDRRGQAEPPARAPAPADAPAQGDAPAPAVLTLESVTYRHAPGRAPVLSDVTLSVAAGEWLALTGASGAGKSTLLLLAAGLLEPEAGRVTLAAGRSLSYLPQRSQLFAGTIAENLRLADPHADDDRLREVLRVVALDEVVAARGGLGSRLGDGGTGLSGGESRRLALARVLLREADVLLLDEPTTGLDAESARRVLDGLRGALAGRAVLTASHQAGEIAVADRRLVVG